MAVETVVVPCPAGQYTALATNKVNCSFRLRTLGGGKMVISADNPPASSTLCVSVGSADWHNIGSMSGTEDVWFMPNGDTEIEVEVIRG